MITQVEPNGLGEATVRELCGDISDGAVLEIIDSGATVADVETALAWLVDGEAVSVGRPPLSGAASSVLDVLLAETAGDEES